MRQMLIVKQAQEVRRKQLQSKIDAAEHRLQEVMECNAINEKKLHDM